MKILTRPQERLLWAAMKGDTDRQAATTTAVKRRMRAAGFLEIGRKGYEITKAGLEALLYWHALRDCRSGCIAYMDSRAEVEAALAARFPEPLKLAA